MPKKTPLNEFQRLVAIHYAAGDFSYMTTKEEVYKLRGDSVFEAMINLLDESEDLGEAIDELTRMKNDVEDVLREFEFTLNKRERN